MYSSQFRDLIARPSLTHIKSFISVNRIFEFSDFIQYVNVISDYCGNNIIHADFEDLEIITEGY